MQQWARAHPCFVHASVRLRIDPSSAACSV